MRSINDSLERFKQFYRLFPDLGLAVGPDGMLDGKLVDQGIAVYEKKGIN